MSSRGHGGTPETPRSERFGDLPLSRYIGRPTREAAHWSDLTMESVDRLTTILSAVNLGDPEEAGRVMPLVYDELRALARRHLRSERTGHTLQPTALVHEVYMRLADSGALSVNGRQHFLRVAARAMRQILVDAARARNARKRGGEWRQVTLEGDLAGAEERPWAVIDLHEALARLAELSPELERLVELRFFAGLTVSEAASVLEISPRKAAKDWAAVRLWLRRELGGA